MFSQAKSISSTEVPVEGNNRKSRRKTEDKMVTGTEGAETLADRAKKHANSDRPRGNVERVARDKLGSRD